MKILVCIDLSPVSKAVLDVAGQLAAQRTGELHLLHVASGDVLIREYDPEHGYAERAGLGSEATPGQNLPAERVRRARQSMDLLAERLRAAGASNTVTHLYTRTNTVTCILDTAETLHPDMIVVGSHGHGMAYHLLLGSTTQGILRRAKCPVLVVPALEAGQRSSAVQSA